MRIDYLKALAGYMAIPHTQSVVPCGRLDLGMASQAVAVGVAKP